MAIMQRFWGVLVRKACVETRYPGGAAGFATDVPNGSLLDDGELLGASFMSAEDLNSYLGLLANKAGLLPNMPEREGELAITWMLSAFDTPDWLERLWVCHPADHSTCPAWKMRGGSSRILVMAFPEIGATVPLREVPAPGEEPSATSGSGPRPIYTIMPDYGGAWAWVNRHSVDDSQRYVSPNIGMGNDWDDEKRPIAAALACRFGAWQLEYEEAPVDDHRCALLDWDAFHRQGLALTRRLKQELGAGVRVVYRKSSDDPNHEQEERQEVLEDGSLRMLPPIVRRPSS